VKTVSLKLEKDLVEQIDRYALHYGLNRSEALRKIIKEVTEKEFKNEIISKSKVEKSHQ